MGAFSSFFDNLYTKFLLRDLLSKAIPGFIAIAGIANTLGVNVLQLLNEDLNFYGYLLLYGVSFAMGSLMQFAASNKLIRVIKIHAGDEVSKDQSDEMTISLKRLKGFLVKYQKNQLILDQRERLVILKNMAGNYAVAFLLIATSYFAKPYIQQYPLFFIILVVLALLAQNRYHATEQSIWQKITRD